MLDKDVAIIYARDTYAICIFPPEVVARTKVWLNQIAYRKKKSHFPFQFL